MKKAGFIAASSLLLIFGQMVFGQVLPAQAFTVLNKNIRQGSLLIITISYWRPGTSIKLFGRNFRPNGHGVVYVGIDPGIKPGKYPACFADGNNHYCDDIAIADRKFPESRISRNMITPSLPAYKDERIKINSAFSKSEHYGVYEPDVFVLPIDRLILPADITDQFYRRRFFLNGVGIHRGVDLRAKIGTPVKSIGSGKVLLTAFNFSLEGNAVIIDHGSGIASQYLHLSRLDVYEGQTVKSGDVIGLSGDTGLGVRGPHLHLAVKVRDIYIDPLEFIDTMNSR